MSRLENHAMLRDAATDVLIYSMLSQRNMARPQSKEFFRGKLIFYVIVHMNNSFLPLKFKKEWVEQKPRFL